VSLLEQVLPDWVGTAINQFLLPDLGISGIKAQWAYDHIVTALNGEVATAASRYGWHLVKVAGDFATHGYSAPDPGFSAPDSGRWVNTLEESLHNQSDWMGTLHPNAMGYQDYARKFLASMNAGTLTGFVCDDGGAGGDFDPNSLPRLTGGMVYVDLKNLGRYEAGDPMSLIDAQGHYRIDGVPPGSQTVRVVPFKSNWWPDHTGTTVTVRRSLDGDTLLNLGGYHPATLGGEVFVDSNRDGALEQGEPGAAGRAVLLDLNNNGVRDPLQTVTVSSNGAAASHSAKGGAATTRAGGGDGGFSEGPPTVSLSSVSATGLGGLLTDLHLRVSVSRVRPTRPADRLFPPHVMLISPWGQVVALPWNDSGTLSGRLPDFFDQDPNGVWQLEISSEPNQGVTLRGWSLTLTSGEPLASTDANGHWAFANLRPGTYTVRELPPPGVALTTPGSYTTSVGDGQSVPGLNFGEQPPTQ
jgi:hypothetical protein